MHFYVIVKEIQEFFGVTLKQRLQKLNDSVLPLAKCAFPYNTNNRKECVPSGVKQTGHHSLR